MHFKTNINESSKLLISSLFILFASFVKLVAILCVNLWDNNFSKEFTRFLGCVLSNLLMSALECGNFCLIVTTARSVYLSSLISSTVMMDLTHTSLKSELVIIWIPSKLILYLQFSGPQIREQHPAAFTWTYSFPLNRFSEWLDLVNKRDLTRLFH